MTKREAESAMSPVVKFTRAGRHTWGGGSNYGTVERSSYFDCYVVLTTVCIAPISLHPRIFDPANAAARALWRHLGWALP